MKILIFTDSRGEHKKTFEMQHIFTEKIKINYEAKDHKVTLMLCPFTWTTTLDFLECINNKIIDINQYDLIILYTGIVEASPRPISNFNKLLNGSNDTITYNKLVSRNRSIPRISNNKLKFLKTIIPPDLLSRHLNNNYNVIYSGENTNSFVNIEMYEKNILPLLKKYESKLLFINSNKIVSGWEGNYLTVNKNGRPKNISIIEKYSNCINKSFKNVVNLLVWDDTDVKKYTIDNMHLSFLGSEYIYTKICEFIDNYV